MFSGILDLPRQIIGIGLSEECLSVNKIDYLFVIKAVKCRFSTMMTPMFDVGKISRGG